MVNLYDRNGTLYVEYMEFGKRIRRSLKIKNTKANKTFAIRYEIPRIEARLMSGIRSDYDIKLSAFVDRFIVTKTKEQTTERYIYGKEQIFKVLDDRDITEYKAVDFKMLVETLRKQGLKDRSIRGYLSPICSAFKEAMREGVIQFNPCILPKMSLKGDKKIVPYNLFQISTLLKKSTGELRTFLYIAFYTGARPNEVLALSDADVDLENSLITINKTRLQTSGEIQHSTKTGEARTIYMQEILKKYLQGIGKFSFERDDKKTRYAFQTLCKKLGYPVQGLHSTRHTFISICCSNKLDLKQIQEMVGHKDSKMINEVYSHFMDSGKKRQELEKAFDLAQFRHTS